jgi:hypothetical protein
VAGAEGTRGTEGGGREGTGRSCRVLWDAGRTWALSLREVGAMEGCGQGREGLAHGRSRAPPGCCGRTGCGGGAGDQREGTELLQICDAGGDQAEE